MLSFLNQTEDVALYPHQDPEVVRRLAALHAAREALAPMAQAWKDYCAAHVGETVSVPFSREKQRLFDQFTDASWALEDAEATLRPVLDAATQRAKALWDARIREQLLDDSPAIEVFIELLAKHEQMVVAAELAGVRNVLNVPQTFLTAAEVATRLAYAKGQLGLD